MKMLWSIPPIDRRVNKVIKANDKKVVETLLEICIAAAMRAKEQHSYRNIKGELESSTAVIIIKDRKKIEEWKLLNEGGRDPQRGFTDLRRFIRNNITGKDRLPDGTFIPEKSIYGIVVAAAPYAAEVEKRRTVLNEFMPSYGVVFSAFKEALS